MKPTSLARVAATATVLSVLSLIALPKAQAQTETVLYSFCSIGEFCNDGRAPNGPLTVGWSGNFYGNELLAGNFRACHRHDEFHHVKPAPAVDSHAVCYLCEHREQFVGQFAGDSIERRAAVGANQRHLFGRGGF